MEEYDVGSDDATGWVKCRARKPSWWGCSHEVTLDRSSGQWTVSLGNMVKHLTRKGTTQSRQDSSRQPWYSLTTQSQLLEVSIGATAFLCYSRVLSRVCYRWVCLYFFIYEGSSWCLWYHSWCFIVYRISDSSYLPCRYRAPCSLVMDINKPEQLTGLLIKKKSKPWPT